jgi:hypothetical protein
MRGVVVVLAMLSLSACELPWSLGLATTRELERGAVAAVASARSLELAGLYVESGERWTIDLQVSRPNSRHVVVENNGVRLEAIVIDGTAYFRSPELLAQQTAAGRISQGTGSAIGNGWWIGSFSKPPDLVDFTDGPKLRATFVNEGLVARHDHVAVAGIDTAELSGPLADVYIRESAPHQLVRVRMRSSTAVDGVTKADLVFSHYGADFNIAAPANVVDFQDINSLPPSYTVLSVDGSGCGSPCRVQATLKNLGGRSGAKGPSTVAFTMADLASGKVIGNCTGTVAPDVDFNGTTTVSCTIDEAANTQFSGAKVTATPTNPGHA